MNIWHCCSSESRHHSLDNYSVVFSPLGGGGDARCPFSKSGPSCQQHCIFRSCFSLIVSQPLICHSPDEYKLKHNNKLWRNIFSHPNLQFSEPRARSGWSPWFVSKATGRGRQPGEAVPSRFRLWWMAANQLLRRGKGLSKTSGLWEPGTGKRRGL